MKLRLSEAEGKVPDEDTLVEGKNKRKREGMEWSRWGKDREGE